MDVESYEMYDTLIAKTCNDARKYPQCNKRGIDASSCYVQGGDCYCDLQCASLYNDCCEDASSQYSSGELM